eukprot:TRINITY_DN16916_c0_g1_i1.p1 TRINITY_DN16916_c0_g1~~TRINITY_DN16916_c0_g1_i1.p1  ORF type:complete len:117 (+),score=22.98 TRINITY_DN16916_c0_g1_i1:61-411(+)
MACAKVTEETVYLATGNPSPKDIHQMFQWLFNEDFTEAYKKIMGLKTNKGLATADILKEVHAYVGRLITKQPDVLINLYIALADIEYRLASGASEKIQLGSLVGAFQLAREALAGD